MIKTHVYEIIWNETQINSEFLVKKKYRREKSQIPILQGQTLEKQKIKHYTLATLCLFQGRTPQVFNWGDFLPTEINTLNFLSLNEFKVLLKCTT